MVDQKHDIGRGTMTHTARNGCVRWLSKGNEYKHIIEQIEYYNHIVPNKNYRYTRNNNDVAFNEL